MPRSRIKRIDGMVEAKATAKDGRIDGDKADFTKWCGFPEEDWRESRRGVEEITKGVSKGWM